MRAGFFLWLGHSMVTNGHTPVWGGYGQCSAWHLYTFLSASQKNKEMQVSEHDMNTGGTLNLL